ncbi:hypothetical protein, partial [Streptomyces anulatus]|uniref:hypothetical protein n=1 Tax=Streptomyces anulatus TaxID=1892 RepID=UPI003443E95D
DLLRLSLLLLAAALTGGARAAIGHFQVPKPRPPVPLPREVGPGALPASSRQVRIAAPAGIPEEQRPVADRERTTM